MPQRFDIVHIDFQANARGANAAIESMRKESERCDKQVKDLKQQLQNGIQANLPQQQIDDLRRKIKGAEKEAKQFKSAYKELAKGMRALDQGVKAFNDGTLSSMNAAFQKTVNNAAKLASSKLNPKSSTYAKDSAELKALTDATQTNYARLQTNVQRVLRTIRTYHGQVSRQAVAQELQQQNELLSVLSKTDTGYKKTAHTVADLSYYLKAMDGNYVEIRSHITDTKKVSDEMLSKMYGELQKVNNEGQVSKYILKQNAAAMREIRTEQARRVQKVLGGDLGKQSEASIRNAITNARMLLETFGTASSEAQRLSAQIVNAEAYLKKMGVEGARAGRLQTEAAQQAADKYKLMESRMLHLGSLSQNALAETQNFWQEQLAGAARGSAAYKKAEANLKLLARESASLKSIQAFRVLNKKGQFGDAEIRRAITLVEQLRDAEAHGSSMWTIYNNKVQEARQYLDQWAQSDALTKYQGQMRKLSTISDTALAETKKFWETTVANTARGSAELATYQANLEKVRQEEARRGQVMPLRNALAIGSQGLSNTFRGTPNQLKQARQVLEETLATTAKGTFGYRQLQRALEGVAIEEKRVASISKEVDAILKSPKGRSFNELKMAVEEGNKALHSMSRGTKEQKVAFDELSQRIKKADLELRTLGNTSKGTTSAFQKAWSRLRTYITLYMGTAVAIQRLVATMGDLMTLSDKMGEVRKTTGFTAEQVGQLATNLSHLDTRTPIQNLMDLAAAAGQLGLKSEEDVRGFTEASNMMLVALPEMGKDGATQMMKIAIATGEVDKIRKQMQAGTIEGSSATAVAMTKIASTIDRLRATTAAAAPPITDFVKRVGAVGAQSGISIDQVAALGATVDELGMGTEMAATAISRMIPAIKNNAFDLAQAIGVTPDTIRKLYDSGHAMDVILMILQHIKDQNLNPDGIEKLLGTGGLQEIMKELNQRGARAGIVFSGLSQNVDELRRNLQTANNAYRDGTAIMDEYNRMNDTTAGKWARLKNQIQEVFVNDTNQQGMGHFIDGLRKIVDLLVGDDGLSVAFRGLLLYLALIKINFASIAVGALASFAKGLKNIAVALGIVKGTMEGLSLSNVLLSLATAVVYVTYKFATMKSVLQQAGEELGKVQLQVGQAESRFDGYWKQLDATSVSLQRARKNHSDLDAEVQHLSASTDKSSASTANLSKKQSDLKNSENAVTRASNAHRVAIANINAIYGRYLGFLLTEKNYALMAANAHDKISAAIEREMLLKQQEAAIDNVTSRNQTKITQDYGDLAAKMAKKGMNPYQVSREMATLQNFIRGNVSYNKGKGKLNVNPWVFTYLKNKGIDIRGASTEQIVALWYYFQLREKFPKFNKGDVEDITGVRVGPRGFVNKITAFSTNVRAGFASSLSNNILEAGATKAVFDNDVSRDNKTINNANNALFQKNYHDVQNALKTITNPKSGKKAVSDAYEQLANDVEGMESSVTGPYTKKLLKKTVDSIKANSKIDHNRLATAQQNIHKTLSQQMTDVTYPDDSAINTSNYTPTKFDPGETKNVWGEHLEASSTDWKKMNAKELVARRKQMNDFVKALQGDTDVESVLSEDPALMAAIKKGTVKKDADSVIAWYDQQRLAIQDVLHSRALTNTGNWKDPKVAHHRAKSISAMVKNDMSYYMDELDAYYTEQKSQIEDAQNSGLITEEEGWRRILENDRIWRQRRAELQQLYAGKTKEVTRQEADNIYSIIAERTGDTADFIKVNIGKTNDLIHQAGLKNVSVERRILGDLDKGTEQDFLKMRTAVKKQLDAIEEIVSKERPFDGIVKNLRQNVEKMGIIYTDLDKQKEKLILSGKGNGSDEMKALNEEYAKERPNRLTFLLKESENAYQKTGDTLLSDMRAHGFSSWADAITQSDDADKLKEALVAQLHTVFDSVQDAIKKEASEVKKQVDIAWNDTNVPLLGGKSMKNLYEAATNALGVEQQSVSRANSLIGAGAASERVADKLAIRQLQIQLNMQEHYYALVRKIGQQRVDDLKRQEEAARKAGDYAKAEELALDAKHAKMSLNLTLSEEETDLAKQRAEINARVEESQNRLYTSLKEWGTLLSSSMQSLFEASNTGAADYYNNLAKMRLTGEGSAGGTYVIIDNAGTKDAQAHYENLDGEDALKRQLEIEQQNAVADAWKKVMDDINKKISEQITDWMNAALQTQSIDANTAALEANTAALYATRPKNEGTAAPTAGKWEMGKDEDGNTLYPLQPTKEAESGDLSKWPRARRKRAGLSADGKYDAPVWQLSPLQQEDAEQHSMWTGLSEYGGGDEAQQGASPLLSDDQMAAIADQNMQVAQSKIDASNAATEAVIAGNKAQLQSTKDTGGKMAKASKSTFSVMAQAMNMYGLAYQVMSNENMSSTQKFLTFALQSAGQVAIAMLTTNMLQTDAQSKVELPGILGKAASQLGPIAGPIAFAAMTALLGGLMAVATSKVSKSKSQISQVTGASVSAGRLSTGMLTYATGNVNEFTDPSTLTPGQQYNVDAADGHTYRARYMGANPKTHLTNGPEFHLVGERGREAIIDANTTRQLQMDDTGIWKSIQTLYNGGSIRSVRRGGMKAFATGNIDELADGATAAEVSSDGTAPATSNTDLLAALQASLDRNTEVMQKAVEHGIKGVFNVYGKEGLIDSYDRGKKNANRYGERY